MERIVIPLARPVIPANNLLQPENSSRTPLSLRRVAWATIAAVVLLLPAIAIHAQGTFATEKVATTSTPQTVTLTSTLGGTVSQVLVLTMGAPNLDFAAVDFSTCAGTSLALGATCTVSVTFTPAAPGTRMGAVVLLDSSGNVLGVSHLSGLGSGGLGVLVPANIAIVAGTSRTWTSLKDGIPATSANLDQPASEVLDGAGNLYIADSAHNKIRIVAAPVVPAKAGVISTYVGTGDAGYSGNGAAATGATLNGPTGVALDGAGNLFIADTGNNVVRKVTTATGIITTVAGTGKAGFSGDNGLATTAELSQPGGVTIDRNGNLYIADTGNQRIRRVDAFTGSVTTVAGNGTPSGQGDGKGTYSGDGAQATTAGLSLPYAVVFDSAGNMYIPDSANNRVRMVNSLGAISTVAGSAQTGYTGDAGPATAARLSMPSAVAVDAAGNLYISDTQNAAVRKVNGATGVITSAAFNGAGTELDQDGTVAPTNLYAPFGLFLDGKGNLYVSDYFNMVVLEIQGNFAVLSYEATPVRQGDNSLPKIEQVENDGNAPLDLTQLKPGANALFDASSTTCTTGSPYMAVDETCNIGGVFAPTAPGDELRGDLNIENASANTPLDIALIGDATPVNSTTVAVASNPNPANFGGAVAFTATVTTGAGTGSLTGTVTFTDGTTNLAPNLALNKSVASFATSVLAVGSHPISATYSGDKGHFSSTSAPALLQVINVATSVALSSSANPSGTGSMVTFTARVITPKGAGVTPDGTVTFFDGNTILGNSPVGAGAVATYSTAALKIGLHPITALYGGDSALDILGSTSSVLNQDVQASSTAVVTSSLNPSTYGVSVAFTATITSAGPGTPTGPVNFFDAGRQIGSANLAGATAAATITTSTLTVGPHIITVRYGGDTNNAPSASAAISQTVNPTQTAVAETATPNPGIAGVPVTIIAVVKAMVGIGSPTGTVTFTDGKVTLGNATIGVAGMASISPKLAPGSHSIVATYAGDTDDSGSVSAGLALMVKIATTAATISASPNPALVQSAIVFSTNVSGNGGMPTGSVSFLADGKSMGSANLDATGAASLTYSALPVGGHSITAFYAGDTNDSPSTSSAITQVVGTIPTQTNLGASMTTGTTPQLILVATVLGVVGPNPTGKVTFSSGKTVIGSAALDSSGLATMFPELSSGNYTIVASYGGDPLHSPSTSKATQVTTPAAGFDIAVKPSSITIATTQNITVQVGLSSVAGFADTIGLGCASLPARVTCHFSQLTADLAKKPLQTVQLTIDTNSPLSGGTSAMNAKPGVQATVLSGIYLPIAMFFGLVFWRFRKKHAAVLTLLLILTLSSAVLLVTGCGGFSQNSAEPGTYTIEVVGVGANSNITHYQNVTLTVTR